MQKIHRIYRVVSLLGCFAFSFWLSTSLADTTPNKATTKVESHQKEKGQPDQEAVLQELRKEVGKLSQELSSYKSERYKIENDYAAKYYIYLGEKADANIEQFKWQRSASERILWLVVVVVFSGVAFSGYQLWRASDIKGIGESSIEIAAQKIKVTSSVAGVIVLAISIVFFYFFLIEVYRVKIVDLTSSEVKPPTQVESDSK